MPDDDLEECLNRLFGEPISTYTDDQAVADGVLIPFVSPHGDTGHRITRSAFVALENHHRAHGYANYDHRQFYQFFFSELLPLVPEARRRWESGEILKSTYSFDVVNAADEILWYVPNELAGVTLMLPTDY